jgi:cyclic beta-1,2-glucan synthetase
LEYLKVTDDYDILDVQVRYLEGDILEANQVERYFEPNYSNIKEGIYSHCVRALEKACSFGEHGLSLIGGGDWNDGYDNVGIKGKGESVWLSIFFSDLLFRFADICIIKKDLELAKKYKEISKNLKENIEKNAWDGGWYLRAFYDDGSKMGSSLNKECKIDSLPQSFAAICDLPNKQRVQESLKNAYNYLVDKKNMIIKLFDLAFSQSEQQPGYVKAYPAGIRENGGQYTHAAIWLAWGFLKIGKIDVGYNLLQMINPIYKAINKRVYNMYKLEPYCICADIYTNSNCFGRAGWNMYTGAASWYYKIVLEYLLGINIRGSFVELKPNIPNAWNGCKFIINIYGTKINVSVERCLKGRPLEVKIPIDGGVHDVTVFVPITSE